MSDQRHGPGRQYHVPAPGGTPDPPPHRRVAPSRTPAPAPPARPAPAPTAAPPGGRPPSGRGRPAPATPSAPRRRRRHPVRWAVLAVLVLLVAVAGFLGLRAWRAYQGIERVDLSQVLDPVSGDTTNYLLVGSDSREGFDPDVGPGGRSTVTGRRSDTIILLGVGPQGSRMMSIPRDLWIDNPATGRPGRVNGAYNAGPANLVRTVQQNLDVPVNHYMEVGFASFAGVVDALGGVTIDVPHPARDPKSGLDIPAGQVTLDGRQALSYVRSRTYTEIIDGRPVTDPTGDLGREERQQQFLRTALADVGQTRNPFTLVGVAESMSTGLVVDDSLGMWGLFTLARRLGGSSPETVVLPTSPTRKGGAAVLVLEQPEADAVLATFR